MTKDEKKVGKNTYSFLKSTLNKTWGYIVALLLLSALSSKLVIYVPMFIEYAIDGVVMGKTEIIPNYLQFFLQKENIMQQLVVLAIGTVVVNLLICLFNLIRNKINTYFNLRINRNIKTAILEHIQTLTYESFGKTEKSEIIQRINNDATTYASFFNSQLNFTFDTIFILLFAITAMLQLNNIIGGFILFICIIILGLTIWFYKVSRPVIEKSVYLNKKIIALTNNSVQNAKMIRIFNRKEKELQEFKQVNDEYKKQDVKNVKLQVWYRIWVHTVRNFKEPFILLFGGLMVIQGSMSLAELVVILTFATKITQYLYDFADKFQNINEFTVAYHKLNDLMNVQEESNTMPDKKLSGNIVFKDVTIYIEGTPFLKNINITLEEGANIAILGDNGSGKTIIIKTILGFYPYTGTIYIGKEDIKKISKYSVRRYIGLILQDTFIFQGTIRDNISLLEKEMSDIEIEIASKAAGIYEEIQEFPEGLNSFVASGGTNLSGGQKQRIAIARTLIDKNTFIVFDDSLSKLDENTKRDILENLICINKGIILISHDIEVAKASDKVIFIESSDKVIQSTHEKLIEENEMYRQMMEVSRNTLGESYV